MYTRVPVKSCGPMIYGSLCGVSPWAASCGPHLCEASRGPPAFESERPMGSASGHVIRESVIMSLLSFRHARHCVSARGRGILPLGLSVWAGPRGSPPREASREPFVFRGLEVFHGVSLGIRHQGEYEYALACFQPCAALCIHPRESLCGLYPVELLSVRCLVSSSCLSRG